MVLYNLGVRMYGLAIRAASFRGAKAAAWVRGRRNWKAALQRTVNGWNAAPVVWVHCASYGEFEQGRPVIELLRKKYPEHRVLLTFFSPSGYIPFSGWKGADAVVYLPLDTPANASDFISIVRPSAVLFIKYEFWLNYLKEIKNRGIPCYLVSAVFKPHHPFFRWYGAVFRRSLATFKTLFIQDRRSGQLLESIGVFNYLVTGDTRFDRVLQIKKEKIGFDWLVSFRGESKLIVAGSTWPSDDDLVLEALKTLPAGVKLVLVPHDVDTRSMEKVRARVAAAGTSFSVYSAGVRNDTQVLVLDTVGMLSRVYSYANVAYVGGGFDGGIHNSLEPAVFGAPVTFYGNDYTKFNEAVDLLSIGAAVNVRSAADLAAAWTRLLEPAQAASVKKELAIYFSDKGDAGEKVVAAVDF